MQKVKKRDDGRYQAQVYIGIVDGKRKYKYVYADSQRTLDKKVQELKIKLGKGIDVTADRDTFGYWAEKWLKFKRTEVSERRYAAYRTRVKSLEPLDDFKIVKLTTSDIQDVIIDVITERKYTKYTASELKNVAKQIMQLAIDNRVVDYNCAQAVKLPKGLASGESRRALTEDERQWIIDTPHRAQTAAMIMMFAGLRRGELIPLTWQDIDLKAKTISVSKSVELIGSKITLKDGGKSAAATRTVYIPKVLVDYLNSIKRPPFELVCTSARGKMLNATAWDGLWESYLNDLNLKYGNWGNCLATNGSVPSKFAPTKKPFLIPRFTAHWLRHTFITLMYLAGVDVLTAREQAGHADIKTTMSIYTHLDSQYKQKSIAKLDDYLSNLNACHMPVSQNYKTADNA